MTTGLDYVQINKISDSARTIHDMAEGLALGQGSSDEVLVLMDLSLSLIERVAQMYPAAHPGVAQDIEVVAKNVHAFMQQKRNEWSHKIPAELKWGQGTELPHTRLVFLPDEGPVTSTGIRRLLDSVDFNAVTNHREMIEMYPLGITDGDTVSVLIKGILVDVSNAEYQIVIGEITQVYESELLGQGRPESKVGDKVVLEWYKVYPEKSTRSYFLLKVSPLFN